MVFLYCQYKLQRGWVGWAVGWGKTTARTPLEHRQWLKCPVISKSNRGRLNSLKVVGAQLTNKIHFYCKKLNSYEHLQILWGQVPPVLPWFGCL